MRDFLALIRAVCIACHRFKTSKHDVPRAAKTQRQQDKNSGIRKSKKSIASRPFTKADAAKMGKQKLAPRKLFKQADGASNAK
jgi:hypothetical protein